MTHTGGNLLEEDLPRVLVLSSPDRYSVVDASSLQDTKTKDDASLAQLGHKSEFKRGFSVRLPSLSLFIV